MDFIFFTVFDQRQLLRSYSVEVSSSSSNKTEPQSEAAPIVF